MTPAQTKALAALREGDLVRNREGWTTTAGAFVALIVVAKLRKSGFVMLDSTKRRATLTLRGSAFA